MNLLNTELPAGWQWQRVRDFYQITRKPHGINLSPSEKILFIPMDAIPQDGEFTPNYHLQKPISEIKSGTYFERGDLLVAKITPSFENGKQALLNDLSDPFAYGTTEVIPLRPTNSTQDSRFLFYYLLHPDVRSYLTEKMEGSTGRQRVPENVLLDLPFPNINSADQHAIANVLATIQSANRLNKNALKISNELKYIMLQTLFTRGLRDEGQKETEIGLIPKNWTLVPFASIRQWLQYGTSIPCTEKPQSYPVLRIPNIEPGRVIASNLKFCDLSEKEASRYLLEEGDFLFIRTNGVIERLGSCAIYSGNPPHALFASYLIRARLRLDLIEPSFAAYFFASPKGTHLIASSATPAADGKYNLNTGTIDSLLLPLPPSLDEQREIIEILKSIEQKIHIQQKKQTVLENLFKTLLHKLLTGEVRVNDLDLSILERPVDVDTAGAFA